MSSKTALVTRATGSQGKAVTKHLLKAGWIVHALVRDPDNARALEIKDLGASLHKGDLNDTSSVEAALTGCNAIFLVQMPSFTDKSEIQDAKGVLEAAKKVGVKHIVHSTSLTLSDPNIEEKLVGSIAAPAILNKLKVEELVKASGIPYTIIRPGVFMTHYIAPFAVYEFPELAQGKFINSYGPDASLALVDPDDIGAVTALALEAPTQFNEQIINLSSEKLGVADLVKQLSDVTGGKIETVYRTEEEIARDSVANPMISGQLRSIGLEQWVDYEALKELGLKFTTFKEFLDNNRDKVLSQGSALGGNVDFYSTLLSGKK